MAAMPIIQSVGKFNSEVETFENYKKRIKINFENPDAYSEALQSNREGSLSVRC